jgi:VanZ family protein
MIVVNYWRPIVWAFFIAFLCGIPGKDIPTISWLDWLSVDKWVHAGMFFILHFLSIQSYRKNKLFFSNSFLFLFATVCIVYGGLLEILQGTIFTDRSADVSDFAANTFGVLCSTLFYIKKQKALK